MQFFAASSRLLVRILVQTPSGGEIVADRINVGDRFTVEAQLLQPIASNPSTTGAGGSPGVSPGGALPPTNFVELHVVSCDRLGQRLPGQYRDI